jgi:hypothetical protein
MASLSPRDILRVGAVTGGAILGFEGLLGRSVQAAWTPRPDLGYGSIAPTLSENTGEAILALPEGFKYTVLGKRGAAMADGSPTPAWHDDIAAFQFVGDIRSRAPGHARFAQRSTRRSRRGSAGV